MARARLGRRGEAFAEARLLSLGFRLLARRHHCRWGEVDLVVEDGDCLVFVEVRTRRRGSISPLETVTPRKQRRVYAAAQHWLCANPAPERALRFDVVEVFVEADGALSAALWRNAFEAPD